MCDFVPGELILTFPREDAVVGIMDLWFKDHGEEQHVEPVESMGDVLERLDLASHAYAVGGIEMRRIRVPPGQEYFKMNFLRDRYTENLLLLLSMHEIMPQQLFSHLVAFRATPNSLTSTTRGVLTGGGIEVQLTAYHERYKAMIGVGDHVPTRGEGVCVAILDSGVTESAAFNVIRARDFASDPRSDRARNSAPDGTGHGTVVASIIRDIAPRASMVIYKVVDDNEVGTEWDAIAALLTLDDVDIVNMSLQFGHPTVECSTCGRRTASSRSVVFEDVLNRVTQQGVKPVVLASAGNYGEAQLSFPARFPNVLAVGALTASMKRSSFSNYGAQDHLGGHHPNLFFLPGGETDPEEAVAQTHDGTRRYWGTSFSCAYASGLIASLLRQVGHSDLLSHLKAATVRDGLTDNEGNGMMALAMADR